MLLQTVLRQINLLNVLLLGLIAAIVFYVLIPFLAVNINFTPSQHKSLSEKQEFKVELVQTAPIAEYAIIAEQNIFHPERKIPPEKKDEQQLPKPEFVLYGSLISGDIKLAYLEDLKAPHSTAGRGKRQKTLNIGQSLSGYTAKEIHHNKVIMAKGDEIIKIEIGDNKRKKTIQTASPDPSATARSVQTSSTIEKPKEGGLPPGIVHTSPPPAGASVPNEKTMSRVQEAFDPFMKKKLGVQRQPQGKQ